MVRNHADHDGLRAARLRLRARRNAVGRRAERTQGRRAEGALP